MKFILLAITALLIGCPGKNESAPATKSPAPSQPPAQTAPQTSQAPGAPTATSQTPAAPAQPTTPVTPPAPPQPQDPNTHLTSIGKKFVRDTSHPGLGEAYRDENGLIWGDVVMDPTLHYEYPSKRMSFKNAVAYCKSQGARLPTMNDYSSLLAQFGCTDSFLCKSENMSHAINDKVLSHTPPANYLGDFWTIGVGEWSSYYAHFYEDGGTFGFGVTEGDDLVRCVADTQPAKDTDIGIHTSKTGAIFMRDMTHPSLGVAYRDSHGLVWGDTPADDTGTPKTMTFKQAKALCKSEMARLPSLDELARLRDDLGLKDKTLGLMANGQPVLPNSFSRITGGETIWSNELQQGSRDIVVQMSLEDGEYWYGNIDGTAAVRCVAP